jgi:hypothetical protein
MSSCKDCDGLLQEGCSDGIGIVSTIENEDSSLTFFYSDGSTFTTSILNPTGYYKSYVASLGYSGTVKMTETVVFNNLGTTVNWPSVILDASQPTILPTLGTSTTNPLVAFLTPAGYNAGTYKYFMYVYTDLFNNIVINIQTPDLTFPNMGAFGFTIEIREYI